MRLVSFSAVPVAMSLLCCAPPAGAQWVTFVDQTATRLVADPSVGVADKEERDYAVGDFNRDGWPDVVVARKIPYSLAGGRRGVLLMNENGVLVDRTAELAAASDIPSVSMGMLDATNTRDVKVVDVNNDGWPDLVTANDVSDGLPKHFGHPRVYINLSADGGVWRGFRFEDARIPQLVTISGLTDRNPRFINVAVGDVTGDGFADLFFSDRDSGEVGPAESSLNDFNSRLLINDGAGFFADESLARMGPTFTSPWLISSFGTMGWIADFNNDGHNDILRISTLSPAPVNVAIAYNDPKGSGVFTTQPLSVVSAAGSGPYAVGVADLNHDGRLDLIVGNHGIDRVVINTGTTLVNDYPVAQWSFTTLGSQSNAFSNNVIVADLNRDGWEDFIITDADVDGFYFDSTTRKTHLYRNEGGVSFVVDDSPFTIAQRRMIHDVAVLDIDGDCRLDMVFAQGITDIPVTTGRTVVWMNTSLIPGCPIAPCAADLDGSGAVNGMDLAMILGSWTGAVIYPNCPPQVAVDVNQDCRINGLDIAVLLGQWGPCPK